MKKRILIGALVLVLGVGSIVVYADTANTSNVIPVQRNANFNLEDREAWFKERSEFRSERVKEALESGLITEKEAKEWEEHFKYMEEHHNKNGFMPGGCGGFGMGFGGGRGRGKGMGMGMMRGNRF